MAHHGRDARNAAQATANSNLQAAQTAAAANRVNQFTPWGSTVWSNNNGTWSATQTLSPQQQELLNQQKYIQSGLYGGANQALANINYGPIDTSQMAQWAVNPGQTAQDAIMSRLTPQLQAQRKSLQSELINQGFNPAAGDVGYNTAMDEYTRQANDAYTQAALYGINLGNQQRQAQFSEAYQQANRPAMLAQMLSGAAGQLGLVQAPAAYNVAVPQQATTAGADYNQALQTQLAAQQANAGKNQGLYQGIGSLVGAAAATSPYWGPLLFA